VPLLDMGLTTSKNYVIHFYINGKVAYFTIRIDWQAAAVNGSKHNSTPEKVQLHNELSWKAMFF